MDAAAPRSARRARSSCCSPAASIDATEADRIGLVTRVVPDGDVVDAALETAELIVGNSPFGVRMTKEVMWSQLEIGSLQAGIDLENRTQMLSSFTGDIERGDGGVRGEAPAAVHRRVDDRRSTT